MPRTTHAIPKYRRRRGSKYASGRREVDQAVVTIDGYDHYLGPHGTKASKVAYDRLIGEWLAGGRELLQEDTPQITVAELCAAYWKFAKKYYVKRDKCTGVAPAIKCALRYVLAWYKELPVDEFGPKKLKAIREQMIADNLSRKYINDHIDRIKRMTKWGVGEELVSPQVYQRLRAVSSLAKGKSQARETARIKPVADEIIESTLPHLPQVVADMVQVQRLLGARPGDICEMRPMDIEIREDVWLYRPAAYKTEHLEKGHEERILFIGPRGQGILNPYLEREPDQYCFQPRQSEQLRLRQRHRVRRTPLGQGNRPGTNRKRSPKRSAGAKYPTYKNDLVFGPGRAIRSGDWKLIERYPTPHGLERRFELFNLRSDPSESKNLAESDPDRVRSLRHELATWQKSVGIATYDELAYPAFKTLEKEFCHLGLVVASHQDVIAEPSINELLPQTQTFQSN